jgi:hypothetical protein
VSDIASIRFVEPVDTASYKYAILEGA